ncbi:hypothetical protein WIX39_028090 [Variovorax sp. AB1(2024)]
MDAMLAAPDRDLFAVEVQRGLFRIVAEAVELAPSLRRKTS